MGDFSGKGEKKMNWHVEVKSAVIGGLLVLVCICLMGAMPLMNPDLFGRFQMATSDGHAFVMDSATGQVWSVWAPKEVPTYGEQLDPNNILDTFYAPKL
jgi:hypothetical protein